MTGLTIASPTRGEGKTAVGCALVQALPTRFDSYVRSGSDASDASFFAAAIGLPGDGSRTLRESDALDGSRGLVVAAFLADRTGEAVAALAGERLSQVIGVVVTGAPNASLSDGSLRSQFAARGLAFFGAIPETRSLRASTVAELTTFLGGDVIAGADGLDASIESYMVGAMSHVSGVPYFNRMANKAVICGGNRIDVHLAALGTSCQCIVATGGVTPDPVVLERAEAEGVPIICIEADAVDTLDRVSDFLRAVRFRHPDKVGTMRALALKHLDVAAIAAALTD